MADILIRKVNDEAKERLAAAAARAGASLEAYARRILEASAADTPRPNDDDQPFGTWAARLLGDIDPEVREEFLRNLDALENEPLSHEAIFKGD